MPPTVTFQPGDPAPIFEGRTGGHPAFPFHMLAGRHVVLSFLGSLQRPTAAQALRHILDRHRAWFDDRGACFLGISSDPADAQTGALNDQMPGVRFVRDFDLRVSRLYGVVQSQDHEAGYRPMTLLLDPMLRVVAVVPLDDDGAHGPALDRAIADLPPLEAAGGEAPVLMLPRIFEPELCADLIALHRADGGRPSGFMQDIDARTVEVDDARRKTRRDVHINDTQLQDRLKIRMGRRLIPAIHQAFQFQVTRLERFLVACYDAEQDGFFAAHRDNVTRGTRHRRIAVTINLNGDYDGGELVFPEFGSRRYRAAPGGAAVFSCSLMHEALPVRRGQRYAFLPFLHDEAAEIIRRQNQHFIAG